MQYVASAMSVLVVPPHTIIRRLIAKSSTCHFSLPVVPVIISTYIDIPLVGTHLDRSTNCDYATRCCEGSVGQPQKSLTANWNKLNSHA